jgi:hypothetical protein
MRVWVFAVCMLVVLLGGPAVLVLVHQHPLPTQEERARMWRTIAEIHAEYAYLDGLLAMTHLDYQQAVTTFEEAVQYTPTNATYAEALADARTKLAQTPR